MTQRLSHVASKRFIEQLNPKIHLSGANQAIVAIFAKSNCGEKKTHKSLENEMGKVVFLFTRWKMLSRGR